MALISPAEARRKAGLPALRRQLPRNDNALYAALEAAKQTITTILKSVDASKIKCQSANDLYKVSNAMSGLIRAQCDYERWQAEKNGYLLEASEQIAETLRMELETEPELLHKLLELKERVAARLEAQKDEDRADPENQQ